jgi:hypothetical protein
MVRSCARSLALLVCVDGLVLRFINDVRVMLPLGGR